MAANQLFQNEKLSNTVHLKSFVNSRGIDLFGVANLRLLEGMPSGMDRNLTDFLTSYRAAIVLGVQLGKLGKEACGVEVDIYMEKIALELIADLEHRGNRALIIHPEDEFDPVRRKGLLSLKVLAKAAGLGWQGRSLLIVSPKYGPIHRLIAILTDMELQADEAIPNQCGDCSICVDKCPARALTCVPFKDHPEHREDVLDIKACKGDDGCKICLVVCPWGKQRGQPEQEGQP